MYRPIQRLVRRLYLQLLSLGVHRIVTLLHRLHLLPIIERRLTKFPRRLLMLWSRPLRLRRTQLAHGLPVRQRRLLLIRGHTFHKMPRPISSMPRPISKMLRPTLKQMLRPFHHPWVCTPHIV